MLDVLPGVIDALVSHCRATLPYEGCGLLVAARPGVITQFVPVTNAAASSTRFVLTPAEHLAAERAAAEAGEQIVGVAHSHPDSEAVPSPTDVADAGRYDPFGVLVQAIVDPRAGTVGWFRIVEGAVIPESMRFSSG